MPHGIYTDLEDALLEKYRLKEAIVVDCQTADDEEGIQRALGAAAAFYLEKTLKRNDVIGISSWSATLLAMVDAMHPLSRWMDARVLQILGGVGNPDAEVHATRLTDRLSKLVHGNAVLLPAPGIVGSKDTRQILLEDPYISDVFALFDKVSIALVGIGSIQPSDLLKRSGNVFSPEELNLVREQGAVGDICLRFFAANGEPIIPLLNKRVLGMSLEQLKQVERAVGVAGGLRKHAAIRGALCGEWINVLITDRFTAETLVNAADC
jgi:DNA-binding transcriptional regulator LsrR (DeoR family)